MGLYDNKFKKRLSAKDVDQRHRQAMHELRLSDKGKEATNQGRPGKYKGYFLQRMILFILMIIYLAMAVIAVWAFLSDMK